VYKTFSDKTKVIFFDKNSETKQKSFETFISKW